MMMFLAKGLLRLCILFQLFVERNFSYPSVEMNKSDAYQNDTNLKHLGGNDFAVIMSSCWHC
jgi:hypothetical protein